MPTFRFHLGVLLWRLATTSPPYRWAALALFFALAYALVVLTQAALFITAVWLVGPSWSALPDLLWRALPGDLTDVPGVWHFVALAAVLRGAAAYGTYRLLRASGAHCLWGLLNVLTHERALGDAADWGRRMAWCVVLWAWGTHLFVALVMAAVVSFAAMG